MKPQFLSLVMTGALCAGCSVLPPELSSLGAASTSSASASSNPVTECATQTRALEQVPKSPTAASQSVDAMYWCSKAAEKGDVKSQVALAGLFERGVGTPVSLPDALRWYKSAADKGSAEAQFKVGQMYGRGQGVPMDRNEASRWYIKAAEQGLPEAQYYMGYRYEHGKGIAQSYPDAVRWYSKAAEQGNLSAIYSLGQMNQAGHGVPQNRLEAYKWFNLAATSGIKELIASRDKAAARLTPAQQVEGQRLASDWAKTHTIGKTLTY